MVKVYYSKNSPYYVSDFNIIGLCEKIIDCVNNSDKDVKFYTDREDVFHILAMAIKQKKISSNNIKFYGKDETLYYLNKYLEIRISEEGIILDAIPNSQSKMIFNAIMGIEW